MLVETLILASTASVLALVLAHAAMGALANWGPREVMWIDSLHVNGWAIGFAALLAVAVTLTAGLVPALRLSGLGLQSPGNRTMTADRSQRHLRSALVVAEVAMALMLVSGTGLLLRSFVNLLNVDTGFRRDHVMVMQMFTWDRNPGPVALRSFLDRVTAKVASVPGVEQVGAVQAMPFIESNIDIQAQMRLIDQPPPKPGEEIRASYNVASPSYFTVMDVRPLAGRLLTDRDGPTSPRVVVVSEAFAERYLRNIDPIGQRLEILAQGKPVQLEIVGVVPSLRHERLDDAPRAEVLFPFAQQPTGSITLVARTSVDPSTLIETTKREVWTIDPMQTFYRTATLEELIDRTLVTRRFALIVLTGFAALGLLLAAAGLYGVLSTIASQYPERNRRPHGARRGMARHPQARGDARPRRFGDRRRRGAGGRPGRRQVTAWISVQRDADGSNRDRRRRAVDAADFRGSLLHPRAAGGWGRSSTSAQSGLTVISHRARRPGTRAGAAGFQTMI